MPPGDWCSSATSRKIKPKQNITYVVFSLQLRDQITASGNHTKGEYLQIVKKKEPSLYHHIYPWKLSYFGKCLALHLKATDNGSYITIICLPHTIIKLICIWFWFADELQWASLGPRASGVLCVTMPRDRCPAATAPAPARPSCSNGNFLREGRIVFFLFLFLGI